MKIYNLVIKSDLFHASRHSGFDKQTGVKVISTHSSLEMANEALFNAFLEDTNTYIANWGLACAYASKPNNSGVCSAGTNSDGTRYYSCDVYDYSVRIEEIDTLDNLANLINSLEDYDPIISRIIGANGWKNDCDTLYGICSSDTEVLEFDENARAVARNKRIDEMNEDIANEIAEWLYDRIEQGRNEEEGSLDSNDFEIGGRIISIMIMRDKDNEFPVWMNEGPSSDFILTNNSTKEEIKKEIDNYFNED